MNKKTVVFIVFIANIGMTVGFTHAMKKENRKLSSLVPKYIPSLKTLSAKQLIKYHVPSLFDQVTTPYHYRYPDKRPNFNYPDLSIIEHELKRFKELEIVSRKRGAPEDTVVLIRDACSYLYAQKYFNMSADALKDPCFNTDTILKLIKLIAEGAIYLHSKQYIPWCGRIPGLEIRCPVHSTIGKVIKADKGIDAKNPIEIEKVLVSCTQIIIDKICLPENLKLTVPKDLLLLNNLTLVDISEAEKISSRIFNLPSLGDLTIQNSPDAVDDRIKDQLSCCTSLTSLVLRSDSLSEIPLSIFSLTKLACLDVSNNRNRREFSYWFPNKVTEVSSLISTLTNLLMLTISGDKILLPQEISLLTKLTVLTRSRHEV